MQEKIQKINRYFNLFNSFIRGSSGYFISKVLKISGTFVHRVSEVVRRLRSLMINENPVFFFFQNVVLVILTHLNSKVLAIGFVSSMINFLECKLLRIGEAMWITERKIQHLKLRTRIALLPISSPASLIKEQNEQSPLREEKLRSFDSSTG